jgi:shikimate dehydrogenase
MVKKLGVEIKDKKVMIVGNGGAAKTAKAVISDMGAKEIFVLSRQENTPDTLVKHGDTEVLINTSPVGMYPKNGFSPVNLDLLPKCEGIIDVIYNPSRTALIIEGEKRGIPCINGLSMLVAQAKLGCEIFTDREISETEIDRITKEIEKQTKNIILIGMPGCGKTTAGKNLAAMTGRPFVDSDVEISRVTGRSPSEIITQDGEAAFRKIETEILRELCKESGRIIATGGGAVTVPENKDILQQNGTVIFLQRDISTLDLKDRPLSKNIPELYKKRLPLYKDFANAEVEGKKKEKETAAAILAAWEANV